MTPSLNKLEAEAAALLALDEKRKQEEWHFNCYDREISARMAGCLRSLLAALREAEKSERLCRDAIAETIKRYPDNDAALFVACAVAPLAPITQVHIDALTEAKP